MRVAGGQPFGRKGSVQNRPFTPFIPPKKYRPIEQTLALGMSQKMVGFGQGGRLDFMRKVAWRRARRGIGWRLWMGLDWGESWVEAVAKGDVERRNGIGSFEWEGSAWRRAEGRVDFTRKVAC